MKAFHLSCAAALCVTSMACAGGIAPSKELVPEATALLKSEIAAGNFTGYDCFKNEALIDPRVWRSVPATTKENITTTVAVVCYGEGQGYEATIKDARSGQRLATFSYGRYEVHPQ
ncbi:hypothetical protein [Luteitalea sp.]|uniref:hypothetical protein n=1 Tax=Luteitalea sp. TaxID=2004800 RepID=UPI0025C1C1A2|nr:hypothetical protein [Luteitalea sp.]